ncbi:hypothetical protein Tco_1021050 [Tanacetum coccineum]
MRTRSQSRNSPFNLVEPIENQAPPVVTMDDNRTMAQLLEAPTVGYEDAIVVPEITADNFELKHGLLTLVQNKQFFGHDKEDPHAHIRYFNKITSTMKFPNVPTCLEIIGTQAKFVIHSNNTVVQKSRSSSSSTPGISPDVAELKDMVKALLLDKKNQNQAPTPVKAVEESCVTCGGAHSYRNCPATDGNVYRDNIQEFATQAATANFNQENTVVDFDADPRVPLILGMLHCPLKEPQDEVLGFSDIVAYNNPSPYYDPVVSNSSPTLTPFGDSDFLLFEEADAFLSIDDEPVSPGINATYYEPKGDVLLLEAILNSEPLPLLPNHKDYSPGIQREIKMCKAKTVESSIDEPPEVELKDLPPHLEYAFLEGDNKFPVIIAKDLSIEEKAALIFTFSSTF